MPRRKKLAERDAQVTIIIGRNGTGKSTFCENILKKVDGRALVVTFNNQPKIWRQYPLVDIRKKEKLEFKKGIKATRADAYEISETKNELFKHIYYNFWDGIVVFDDCRGYMDAKVDSNRFFRNLLVDFRHHMLDFFFVVHSPSDVPRKVWGYVTTVFVGATDALINKSDIKTHSADRIIAAQAEVNEAFRKAKEKGDGSHYGIFRMIQV